MIRLEAVGLRYPGFTLGPITVGVSGSVIGVVGPNGAGKTTLLSILGGVYERHDGEVLFDEDVKSPPERRATSSCSGISDAWYESRSLAEHFALLAAVCPQWDNPKALELSEKFELPLNRPMKAFSTGMRVKASTVVAFARQSRVAIFDEPWSSLDPIARVDFSDRLRQLAASGTTVIVSSHDLDLVEAVVDCLLVIDRGRCVFFGTTAEARDHANLGATAPNTDIYRELLRR